MQSLAPLLARLRAAPPLRADLPEYPQPRTRKEEGAGNSREQAGEAALRDAVQGAGGAAENSAEQRANAAFLARAAAAAAAELAAGPGDGEHDEPERAALAAEARGELGQPLPEEEHQRQLAALLRAFCQSNAGAREARVNSNMEWNT